MKKARDFVNKIIELLSKNEMRILPGQLAFFLFMSIIPTAALVGVIANKLSIPLDYLQITVNGSVPKEIAEILNPLITGQGLNFNIIIFFFSAFILASNGPHSIIITSNEIYKIKTNDVIKRRMKAIAMTVMLVGLFIFMFLVPICGDTIFTVLREYFNNNQFITFAYNLYQILKYPLIVLTLYVNIKMIYIIAPDEKIEGRTTRKGAIFTTAGWLIATEIFTFYIGTFSKYDLFYGSISNIIIFLLWLYILSYIFVLGMIFNVSGFNIEKTKNL